MSASAEQPAPIRWAGPTEAALKWLVSATAVIAVAGCAGCGGHEPIGSPSAASSIPTAAPGVSSLGQQHRKSMSALAVVQGLSRRGFLVPNPLDTTTLECRSGGCTQSIVTDTLRVKSFSTVADAARYANTHGLSWSGNVVVSFAPPLTPAERSRYWSAIVGLDP